MPNAHSANLYVVLPQFTGFRSQCRVSAWLCPAEPASVSPGQIIVAPPHPSVSTSGWPVIRPLPREHPATTRPFPMSTIYPSSIRLQKWMNQTSNVTWAMTEQNRQISTIFAEQRSRLRNFIRRRVPDPRDAEDILQDAFYKLVEANRLLMPIDHVTSWLFRVGR